MDLFPRAVSTWTVAMRRRQNNRKGSGVEGVGCELDLQLHDQVVVTPTLIEVLQPHHVVMLYPERVSDKHVFHWYLRESRVLQSLTQK